LICQPQKPNPRTKQEVDRMIRQRSPFKKSRNVRRVGM